MEPPAPKLYDPEIHRAHVAGAYVPAKKISCIVTLPAARHAAGAGSWPYVRTDALESTACREVIPLILYVAHQRGLQVLLGEGVL